ncbi:MAG TPA: BON domain-containing protein [Nitrospiraceae bacterium]|nr:BON domain-containing protein [Nitrospiraceae bacterium]
MRTWRRTMLASLIVALMSSGFVGLPGVAPSAGPRFRDQNNEQHRTDESIRAKIEERLRMADRIDWELLEVTVKQGHATLYGEVKTPQEKGLAALITSTVPGVKGLINSIIVEPAFTRDHKLTEAVWNMLQGVPTLSGNDTLRVNVKNSVVKLEGSVEYAVQKEAAEKAAASVQGVATVINLIEVKSQVSGEIVTEKAREKLLLEGVEVQP